MLPGGTDPLYRRLLARPHRRVTRVEVWTTQDVPVPIPDRWRDDSGGLTFFTAALTATLTSRVTRELTLTVPRDLYPKTPDALLSQYAHELRVWSGVVTGDGQTTYTWQVFRGRIRHVSKQSTGPTTVRCADTAADVIDNNFVNPQNSQPSNSVDTEFRRLIRDAVPNATFGPSDTFVLPVRQLTWELDRGAALDELVSSVGGLWYCLANGDFVIRHNPFSIPQPATITLSETDGTLLGWQHGTLLGWQRSYDREDIFNVVTVTGERLNGDAPVYATVADTNPTSPTFIGGGFGTRSLVQRLHTPSSPAGAQGAARALLSSTTAPVEAWSLSVVPDAALELGDVITIDADGDSATQVVSQFTLPLSGGADMTISSRSLVVNQLSVVS